MRAALIAATLCAVALVACGQAQTDKSDAPETTATSTAAVATESYVGTWAANLEACSIPQEAEGAPHIFTTEGFDQHEAHCTFAAISQTGPNSWHVGAACQVEGDEASLGWDMTVEGDTMQMDPGPRLVRCPA